MNLDSLGTEYSNIIDTMSLDSAQSVVIRDMIRMYEQKINFLEGKISQKDSAIESLNTKLNNSKEKSETIPSDLIHLLTYALIAAFLILFIVFLIGKIRWKRRYGELEDEYDEIDEALEEYDPGDKELIEKVRSFGDVIGEQNKKLKVCQNELADSREKLSFIKVENEKLIEQLDQNQHTEPQATPEQEKKILDLSEEIEKLKIENKDLQEILKDSKATSAEKPAAYLNLSAEAKKQLEEIDLNLAKLERISSMFKSKSISKVEYKELKERIFNKL